MVPGLTTGSNCKGGKGSGYGNGGVGGAGCKAFIVVEVNGCHAGPGGKPCVAWLYAGTTCGVGGDAFCEAAGAAGGSMREGCQVVPAPGIVWCADCVSTGGGGSSADLARAAGALP